MGPVPDGAVIAVACPPTGEYSRASMPPKRAAASLSAWASASRSRTSAGNAAAVMPSAVSCCEPAPAVLLNRVGDIVAWTQGYERYARPLGLLDGDPPNMVRYLFTDDRSRAVFPGWDRLADEQVAHLRSEATLHDPHVAALADELTAAGAPFSDRLAAVPAPPSRFGLEAVEHPEAGRLRLSFETLALADEGRRLVVHMPADEATAIALDRLNGRRPGALRAVSG
ncbi:transcriptional regulator [Streptomyces sp900116325]|uniref:Transcriptional regulator n=1 Tax=Streptomyces sp. 900116325 TaxID=3154295 RepID=A0ABV2UIK7_9ACTN